jgi:hypothetical protein
LWNERCVRSVANLTRADGEEFFRWAAMHTLQLSTTAYKLAQANDALDDLRAGRITGATVLNCLDGTGASRTTSAESVIDPLPPPSRQRSGLSR